MRNPYSIISVLHTIAVDGTTHTLIFSRLEFHSGLTLAVFNFHFIISSLRLLPVVICNFYQDLFIIASDRTDAVINHARQLGIVVTLFAKKSHYRARKGRKKWALK